MPEDKIIKSGQITAPRILFLVACGVVLFVIVALGYLKIGYMLLTAVLCVLLGLIAADYGVAMDKVDFASSPGSPAPVSGTPGPSDQAISVAAAGATTSVSESGVRAKKKARTAKRRR